VFERYADDAVVHCESEAQAQQVLAAIAERMEQVRLRLHPDKTHVVYCKDGNRPRTYQRTTFTFLGYTFRPRPARDRPVRSLPLWLLRRLSGSLSLTLMLPSCGAGWGKIVGTRRGRRRRIRRSPSQRRSRCAAKARSLAPPQRPDTGPADRLTRSSHARTARQLQQVDDAPSAPPQTIRRSSQSPGRHPN
jgi:hypothetical protein